MVSSPVETLEVVLLLWGFCLGLLSAWKKDKKERELQESIIYKLSDLHCNYWLIIEAAIEHKIKTTYFSFRPRQGVHAASRNNLYILILLCPGQKANIGQQVGMVQKGVVQAEISEISCTLLTHLWWIGSSWAWLPRTWSIVHSPILDLGRKPMTSWPRPLTLPLTLTRYASSGAVLLRFVLIIVMLIWGPARRMRRVRSRAVLCPPAL